MVTILQVLKVKGKFTVDNETKDLGTSQILICQGKEMLSLINDGNEELSLYVTLTPIPTGERYADEV